MNQITFFQRSHLGKLFFEQKGSRLCVSGKIGFRKIELDVALCDVSPHFERLRWRSAMLIVWPLFVAAVVGLITWLLRFLPEGLYLIIEVWGVMFVCGFLFAAARGFIPIELMRFRSKAGVPLFDVIKEKKQAEEYEQFIGGLCQAITVIQNEGRPNKSAQTTAMTPPPSATAPAPSSGL